MQTTDTLDALEDEKKHPFLPVAHDGELLQVGPYIDLALFLSCHPIVCQSFNKAL